MSGAGASWVLLQTAPPIDPSIVRPGWTPLLVTTLLMLALVFLFLSMRKQMRKIHVPDDDKLTAEDSAVVGEPAEPATEPAAVDEEPAKPDSR